MNVKHINIAIDGFSSCGKSSIAKEISKNFDMIYVDSGAMYRAVTLFCLENDIISNSKVIRRKLIEKLYMKRNLLAGKVMYLNLNF